MNIGEAAESKKWTIPTMSQEDSQDWVRDRIRARRD